MDSFFDFYLDVIVKEADEMGTTQEKIRERACSMVTKYTPTGLKQPDAIDFNVDSNIHAYLYIYATCYTRMMVKSLEDVLKERKSGPFNRWITELKTDFKICSIGGGSGCDIVAILYFLKKYAILPFGASINCFVVDKYTEWQRPFNRIFNGLQKYGLVSDNTTPPQFNDCDLFDDFSDSLNDMIRNSDLITMSKFVSTIFGNEKCGKLLKKIVEKMKIGALLYFIDNSGGDAYKKLKETAIEFGMELVYEMCDIAFRITQEMEPKMYDKMYAIEFGVNAKRNARITVGIWKKLADKPSSQSFTEESLNDDKISLDSMESESIESTPEVFKRKRKVQLECEEKQISESEHPSKILKHGNIDIAKIQNFEANDYIYNHPLSIGEGVGLKLKKFRNVTYLELFETEFGEVKNRFNVKLSNLIAGINNIRSLKDQLTD